MPGSVEAQAALVTPGGPCDYTGAPVIEPTPGGPLTVDGQLVELSALGADLGNQDGCAVLRFDAIVQDVPDAGEPLNVRPGSSGTWPS